MTTEQIEILKVSNDLLMSQVTQQINSSPLEKRSEGRKYLAAIMEVTRKLDVLKDAKEEESKA